MSSIEKVMGTITGLFSNKEKKKASAKKARSSAPKKTRRERTKAVENESSSLTKLELHLNSLSAKGGIPIAGKVQVLVVDELRNRLGDDWMRLRDRVSFIVETTIKKHVGAKDMFCPYGKLRYLIVFGNMTDDEASLKCVVIREEIFSTLFGESEESDNFISDKIKRDDIQIITAVTAVDGKIELQALDNIEGLFDRLQNSSKLGEKGNDSRGLNDEEPLFEAIEGTGNESDPDWEEFATPDGPLEDDEESVHSEDRPDQIKAAWKSSEVSEDKILKPLQGLAYVYRPLWDAEARQIKYFVATPISLSSTGKVVTGYDVIGRGVAEGTYVSLDIKILTEVLEMATHLPLVGNGAQMIVPVHFQSLSSSQFRGRYAAACRKIPEYLRRNIIFEVAGIPEGVPRSRLQELIMGIGQYGGAISVWKNINKPDFLEFKSIGIDMVGFSLSEPQVEEEKSMDLIGDFVSAATSAGIKVYVAGVPSKNLAMMSIGLGVPLIGSPLISSINNIPEAFQSYDAENLFGIKVH